MSYADGSIETGKHSVVIPSSLPAGEYLMRGEHIALHSAGDVGQAQFCG